MREEENKHQYPENSSLFTTFDFEHDNITSFLTIFSDEFPREQEHIAYPATQELTMRIT